MPGMRLRFASAFFGSPLPAGGWTATAIRQAGVDTPYATHLTAITDSLRRNAHSTRRSRRRARQPSIPAETRLPLPQEGRNRHYLCRATAAVDADGRRHHRDARTNGGAILLSRVGSGVMWISDFDGEASPWRRKAWSNVYATSWRWAPVVSGPGLGHFETGCPDQ